MKSSSCSQNMYANNLKVIAGLDLNSAKDKIKLPNNVEPPSKESNLTIAVRNKMELVKSYDHPKKNILKNVSPTESFSSQSKDSSNPNLTSDPMIKTVLISNNRLEKSVCSSESSAYFTPFYANMRKLSKSSSFNDMDNSEKTDEEANANVSSISIVNGDAKLEHLLHHNLDTSTQGQSQQSNTPSFEGNTNALSDSVYNCFVDSLNCDNNCSCAYHKTNSQHAKVNMRHHYQHHPYTHHHSFDQNKRLSQINLNVNSISEDNIMSSESSEKSNPQSDVDDDTSKTKNRKRSAQFDHGFLEILSFFGMI